FECYARAAELDDLNAQYEMAIMYFRGNGVDANPHKAIELLTNLVEHDHLNSIFFLAQIWEKGQVGIPTNLRLAIEYYQKAQDLGCDQSQWHLDNISENRTDIQAFIRDYVKRKLPKVGLSYIL